MINLNAKATAGVSRCKAVGIVRLLLVVLPFELKSLMWQMDQWLHWVRPGEEAMVSVEFKWS